MSNQNYAIAEWWQDHRRIEGDELATYEARSNAREIVVDEPIGAGAPTTLTVVRPTRDETLAELKQRDMRRRGNPSPGDRPCKTCGTRFATANPQVETRCPSCRDGRIETLTCAGCGEEFTFVVVQGSRQRKYCTRQCGYRAYNRERKAAMPPKEPRYGTCPCCGVTFIQARRDQVYCGKTCRVREASRRHFARSKEARV